MVSMIPLFGDVSLPMIGLEMVVKVSLSTKAFGANSFSASYVKRIVRWPLAFVAEVK